MHSAPNNAALCPISASSQRPARRALAEFSVILPDLVRRGGIYAIHQWIYEAVRPSPTDLRPLQYVLTSPDATGRMLAIVRTRHLNREHSFYSEPVRLYYPPGDVLRFALTCCPGHEADRIAGRPGPVDLACAQESARRWLSHIASEAGLGSLRLDREPAISVWRFKRQGAPVRLIAAEYAGQARVASPLRLARAIAKGLGRHKGFGLGMLRVGTG